MLLRCMNTHTEYNGDNRNVKTMRYVVNCTASGTAYGYDLYSPVLEYTIRRYDRAPGTSDIIYYSLEANYQISIVQTLDFGLFIVGCQKCHKIVRLLSPLILTIESTPFCHKIPEAEFHCALQRIFAVALLHFCNLVARKKKKRTFLTP